MKLNPEQLVAAQASFAEYFARNYPGPHTIIGDPTWHAPKIFRAALHAIEMEALKAAKNEMMATIAFKEWLAMDGELKQWHQVWDNIHIYHPDLRANNKPLAVACVYELQRTEIDKLKAKNADPECQHEWSAIRYGKHECLKRCGAIMDASKT